MKGRDLYDVVFILSMTEPNYKYLRENISIKNGKELKEELLKIAGEANLKKLAEDVAPFVFDFGKAKKVERFDDIINKEL